MVLHSDIDLLHPSAELEKQKHKLKRLVQSPNSFFMVSSGLCGGAWRPAGPGRAAGPGSPCSRGAHLPGTPWGGARLLQPLRLP